MYLLAQVAETTNSLAERTTETVTTTFDNSWGCLLYTSDAADE